MALSVTLYSKAQMHKDLVVAGFEFKENLTAEFDPDFANGRLQTSFILLVNQSVDLSSSGPW